MTTRSDDELDDRFWRRPTEPSTEPPGEPVLAEPDPAASYSGPPPAIAPPPGWRPPVVIQAPPPRQLPRQDFVEVEAEERAARTLTYGVGLAAGAVLLAVMFLLCSRVVF